MDELSQVRGLLDDVPAPDEARKAQARAALLAQAEQERTARSRRAPGPGQAGAGRWEALRRILAAAPRPALAVVVALIVVAGVTAVVYGPLQQRLAAPPQAERQPDDGPDVAAEEPAAAPETAEQEPVELPATCTLEGRYSVGYPADWHANTGDGAPDCAYFGAQPIEVEHATGGQPHGAISIDVEQQPFDELAEAKPPDRRELARTPTTVAGRRAVSLLEQSTGKGMFPEGDRIYRYLVDLGDETLIATAHDGDDPPFEDRADVLDDMMTTISFEDP